MPPDPGHALAVERSPWLRGQLQVPGDAMLTHLAILVAGIARGESVITGGLDTEATAASARAAQALGVGYGTGPGHVRIFGLGIGGLLEPMSPLDFGGSALGAALTMGLVGTYDFPSTFMADPDVSARPRTPLLEALRAFGTTFDHADRGRLPLTLHGPTCAMPVELALPAGEPALKAALLLAALNAHGTSSLTEPAPSGNHAERMLARFGARLEIAEGRDGSRNIAVAGFPELRAQPVEVPANPSLAAVGAAAAAVVPGSELSLARVLLNPARTAVLSALMAMGVTIELHDLGHGGGEEIADLVVRSAPLRAVALAAHHVGPLLDDLPLLSVVAAFAEGTSVFYLPSGLPLLVHARLAALSQALAANGVRNQVTEEAVTIAGSRSVPGGARLDLDDAGIALAMLVLGMGADQRVTLADRSVIKERFPGFVSAFERIGAGFVS